MLVGKLRAYLGLSISGLMLATNSAWAAQTLDYSIRWNTGDNRYHVYMKPTTTPDPDGSISAQVTIRVPHATDSDMFNVSGLSSSISSTSWKASSRSNSPEEAPEYDYISFNLGQLDTPGAFNWQAGKEQEVFSFSNSGNCTAPISLMTDSDPFNIKDNSAGTNPGNHFTNIGWSDFSGENSYRGIYGNNSADCRDSLDGDNDGLNNAEERLYGTDPAIADTDGDGLSDGDEIYTYDTAPLKADTDGDGLPDGEEVETYNTEPKKSDSDGDGLSDGDEVITHKTDPSDSDSDDDGLSDGDEVSTHKTDPLIDDTDGDGLNDGEEVNTHKTDPLAKDTDEDGLLDAEELNTYKTDPLLTDSDDDGLTDFEEIKDYETDPNNSDHDGDGLADGEEVETYNTDPKKSDSDGDGLSDYDEVKVYGTYPFEADTDGDGLSDYDELKVYVTNPLEVDSDGDGFSDDKEVNDMSSDPNKENIAALSLKVLLQGAYSPNDQLMHDDLRVAELIPADQPYDISPINYFGEEKLELNQLDTMGSDAIVDWVLVELRSATDDTILKKRQAALLQRDGDVVEAATGSNKLKFYDLPKGNYYVAVRHRNHLGVMTASPMSFESESVNIDFSSKETLVKGENARAESEFKALLWSGDANSDNRLIANGSGQDSGVVFVKILNAEANKEFNSNFIVKGYHVTDFNMDGRVIFTGPNNDTNILMSNIYSHPGNVDFNANYIVRGQLPQ